MKKISSYHPSDNMEAPCLCDCGNWFDLDEGYCTKKPGSNLIICPTCNKGEMKIVGKIDDIESEIEELEYFNKKPARIQKLRSQLEELKTMLEEGRPLE